jgi:hypothetical protein
MPQELISTSSQAVASNYIESIRLFVMPGWIHRAIIRNKLNIVDATNYAKMRSILSLEDFAEWCYLNDRFKIQNSYIAPITLHYMFDNLTVEQKQEFNISVDPLSMTEAIANSITAKLTLANAMSDNAYQFIVTGENIYLILNEGFSSITNDTNKLLEFIKEYLKVCYSKYSIPRVSLLGLYDLYVKLV